MKLIPLELIRRNPDQPRQNFDQVALEELAASIQQNGLRQPITVRPIPREPAGHEFEIVMGERRFRAHLILQEAGETNEIRAMVEDMSDMDMHVGAIIENLQRENVSPLEEAVAFQRMIVQFGFTAKDLAKRLGISQPWRISDRIKLLSLTHDNQDLLRRGVVTQTQAYHMAGLSPNGQTKFLEVVKAGLATTDRACADTAAAILAKEAQTGMEFDEPRRRVIKSIRSLEESIDRLGGQLMPLFEDGPFSIDGDVNPDDARRSAAKLKLLRQNLHQMENELIRAASAAMA